MLLQVLSFLKSCLLRVAAVITAPKNRVAPPETPANPPHHCHFRLDNDSAAMFTLPDGRKLGYAQYGSVTGRAIFYCHGLPGSRFEGAHFEDLGLELNARIIATDRPGMGWSTPQPGRTLVDHVKDLELLADALGIDTYSVLGVSGGGPYALACAKAMPSDKLKCVAIVCGLGPPDIGMRGANLIHYVGFSFGWKYAPYWVMRWFWKSDPAGRLDLSDDERLERVLRDLSRPGPRAAHPKDLEVMKDISFPILYLRSSRETFAQGYDGVTLDGRVMCNDWGFRLEDIRHDLPVQLWYGKLDTFIPIRHGEQIAARLDGRATLRAEDETHASIFVNYKRAALMGVLACM